jgi:hypothetical protein
MLLVVKVLRRLRITHQLLLLTQVMALMVLEELEHLVQKLPALVLLLLDF